MAKKSTVNWLKNWLNPICDPERNWLNRICDPLGDHRLTNSQLAGYFRRRESSAVRGGGVRWSSRLVNSSGQLGVSRSEHWADQVAASLAPRGAHLIVDLMAPVKEGLHMSLLLRPATRHHREIAHVTVACRSQSASSSDIFKILKFSKL